MRSPIGEHNDAKVSSQSLPNRCTRNATVSDVRTLDALPTPLKNQLSEFPEISDALSSSLAPSSEPLGNSPVRKTGLVSRKSDGVVVSIVRAALMCTPSDLNRTVCPHRSRLVMLPAGNTWFGSKVDGVVDDEVEAGKVEYIVAGLDGDVDEKSLPLCLEGRTSAV